MGLLRHRLWLGPSHRLLYGIRLLVLRSGDRDDDRRIYLAAEKISINLSQDE